MNNGGLNLGLRPEQGQVEPKGTICYPTCGLRRNGDNGTSAQEILPEYRLSQVHGGPRLGMKRSQVRCWGTEQVKGS